MMNADYSAEHIKQLQRELATLKKWQEEAGK
jgi:hypothetical protein